MKYCKTFMKTALLWAENSYAIRRKVGAVLADKTNTRVLACGYNGTPAGQTNCNELFKVEADKFYYRPTKEEAWIETDEADWRARHHEFANEHEVHAEQSCLGYALKWKMDISGASMVLSHEPCESCARLIYCCGIKHIMYVNKYDRGSKGIEFLSNNGVEVEKI